MSKKIGWSLVFTIFLLTSCGGSEQSVEGETLELEIITTDMLSEGEIATLELRSSHAIDSPITWSQRTGPPAFILSDDESKLTFVTPNVDEQTEISFNVRVLDASGSTVSATRSMEITPFKAQLIPVAPRPYMFSSANYAKNKYDFDESGVPIYMLDGEQFYNPSAVASYAYNLYAYYVRYPEPAVLSAFLANARWLRDNCIYTDYGFCSFRYYFKLESYKVNDDWVSAMSQGQALPVLLQAYYLTGDSEYADVAYDALSAFRYPIEQKGMTSNWGGTKWYEEYGSEEMPAHVLNGTMFALGGLVAFTDAYDNPVAQDILDLGIKALIENIELYDLNFTSRYDYSPLNQIASAMGSGITDAYHELHVIQLLNLFLATNIQELKDAAHTFLKQDMAGLASYFRFFSRSIEILEISATYTISPTTHGVNNLNDGNWTYGKYWSSNTFPVDLSMVINTDILESGMLDKIVLSSLSEDSFPTTFDLIEVIDGKEILLADQISMQESPHSLYEVTDTDYPGYTVTFPLNLKVSSNHLIIRIYGAKGEAVGLREIDIQYPRLGLLDDIIEALRLTPR